MKKSKSVQERRRSVRFRIFSLIKHTIESDAVTLQVANILNVSRGGLSFFAGQEIKKGAILKLYFLPPNCEKSVMAQGKVVRCPEIVKKGKVFEVGVQFLDVSKEAQRAILQLEAFFLSRHQESGSRNHFHELASEFRKLFK